MRFRDSTQNDSHRSQPQLLGSSKKHVYGREETQNDSQQSQPQLLSAVSTLQPQVSSLGREETQNDCKQSQPQLLSAVTASFKITLHTLAPLAARTE